jgi:hypothetical protein
VTPRKPASVRAQPEGTDRTLLAGALAALESAVSVLREQLAVANARAERAEASRDAPRRRLQTVESELLIMQSVQREQERQQAPQEPPQAGPDASGGASLVGAEKLPATAVGPPVAMSEAGKGRGWRRWLRHTLGLLRLGPA